MEVAVLQITILSVEIGHQEGAVHHTGTVGIQLTIVVRDVKVGHVQVLHLHFLLQAMAAVRLPRPLLLLSVGG